MVFRRCPQCGSTSDDAYGFCIKCGYEFPKIEANSQKCPLCRYENPDEADYCVKCGTPLLFKNQMQKNSVINPIVINKNGTPDTATHKTSRFLILLGYIFSFLGGLIGLIIAIYLSTRKDPVAKRHGHIQLAIFGFYILIIAILFATGNMPADIVGEYQQLLAGNFTFI
ncbi:MAG: zinc ribbon domain-containing protein [Methanobrevibacter sp.]|uniref:zinc ribbon domain-containing protein n=1 Tax=Methanobrevibacter sp. TaxID=66852 RepID=UPI0025D27EAF|nr:zinc ribbon domain-containing protein [Methanobrevibacter sp.]MBQ6100585.1 zinc ribbon domain-containing protein [Methanobrevibacter sp.]MBQ6100616.1 zinc ribbon domain-containing protein [Methanobrevibacter sp.]